MKPIKTRPFVSITGQNWSHVLVLQDLLTLLDRRFKTRLRQQKRNMK